MKRVVNDFSIHVATVNGSGSQTANTVLLRALLQMGVPVSGKNLFPSNIAGLPTWFTIRASAKGYIARRKDHEVLVVMNPETAAADVAAMKPGSVIVLNEAIPAPAIPEGCTVYKVPIAKLVEPITAEVKLRRLVANMVYVGVLGQLFGVDPAEIDRALDALLGNKKKAFALNQAALKAGADFARASLPKTDPFTFERLGDGGDRILVDGNTAAALGTLFGGVTAVAWYPITPSSSMIEALMGYLEQYRKDPATGRNTCGVVQAEDEIAAIGMILGAGWAGARAMTATSGPGISLMAELTGYAYYTEIPCVIWDVQRIGPSTGLPTRTSQGDLTFVSVLSHGDTKHPILLPSSVEDCFEYGHLSFDLAERLQTPVFVLSDLDLGMNNWVAAPFQYPAKPWDRGKVLDDEQLRAMAKFERYRDVDGDAIPYRTLPGVTESKGGYFTRGSGHDEAARYTESNETYVRVMDRLARKMETARTLVPQPLLAEDAGAEVGIVAWGSSHWAALEARDQLREAGVPTGYLLVKALPFTTHMAAFLKKYPRVYVVDQNRDGQMAQLVTLEAGELAPRVRSVRHYDGLPIDAASITAQVLAAEGRTAAVEGATR